MIHRQGTCQPVGISLHVREIKEILAIFSFDMVYPFEEMAYNLKLNEVQTTTNTIWISFS